MRIPTLQKIEAQAKAYSDSHSVIMPQEWHDEYDALYKEYNSLRKKWDKIENACPGAHGGKCTCREDPLYQTLYVEKIHPLVQIINEMCRQKSMAQQEVFRHYRQMLINAREAKRKRHDLQRTKNDSESSTHSRPA